MIEVLDYIYEKYPTMRLPRWRALSLLDRYEKNIIVEKENGIIIGAAIYVRIDDETLVKIMEDSSLLRRIHDYSKDWGKEGDNIHFVGLVANGIKPILRGLRNLKDYKTVSWFNQDDRDFFIMDKNKTFCSVIKMKEGSYVREF